MLGFTAGTILSTKSIPYRLLGLNGVFLLFDAILNSPYTYIAKYTTLLGIGSYYILNDRVIFHQVANLVHSTMEKQMGIEVEEVDEKVDEVDETEEKVDETEEDIYADMPPLISLEDIAAEMVATEAKATEAAATEAAVPLPPSPLDTDDDLPPPFIPVPDTALMLPVEETVPEEFVPVYKVE
jgi:hypothetical protein